MPKIEEKRRGRGNAPWLYQLFIMAQVEWEKLKREGGGVAGGRVVPHKRAGCLFLALDDDGLPIV